MAPPDKSECLEHSPPNSPILFTSYTRVTLGVAKVWRTGAKEAL